MIKRIRQLFTKRLIMQEDEMPLVTGGIKSKKIVDIKKITYVPVDFVLLKMDKNYIEKLTQIICDATNPLWRISIEKESYEYQLDKIYCAFIIAYSFEKKQKNKANFSYEDILCRAKCLSEQYISNIDNFKYMKDELISNNYSMALNFYNGVTCCNTEQLLIDTIKRCKMRFIEYPLLETCGNAEQMNFCKNENIIITDPSKQLAERAVSAEEKIKVILENNFNSIPRSEREQIAVKLVDELSLENLMYLNLVSSPGRIL